MKDRSTVYFVIAAVFLVFITFINLQYRRQITNAPPATITSTQSVNEPAEVKFT
jgi:hypothetical protein